MHFIPFGLDLHPPLSNYTEPWSTHLLEWQMICKSSYNLSRQEDRHLIVLGPLSAVLIFLDYFSFAACIWKGHGLICITLLPLCIFLGPGLFHGKLALEKLSQQKLCVELTNCHTITMLRKNRSKHWNDSSVPCFVRSRGQASLLGGYICHRRSFQEWLSHSIFLVKLPISRIYIE